MAWARDFASGPTGAITGMKANVHDALGLSLADALPRETERMVASGRHRRAPGGAAGVDGGAEGNR